MSAPEDERPNAEALAETIIPLHAEEVAISRRRIDTAEIRVATVTHEVSKVVREEFIRETVQIERTPIGRIVDTAPEVRQDGDVTIIPVIEEVVVVQRKLLLTEEIRVRRARTAAEHVETVTLRQQDVEVTRTELPTGTNE